MSSYQVEISKCVVKKDLTPEHSWLSSSIDSLKYFLTTVYVYVMKEQWTGVVIIILIIIVGYMRLKSQTCR